MVEKTSDIRVFATEIVKRVNDETRRIRLVEQKIERFDADIDSLERTIDSQNSEIRARLDAIAKEMKSLSDRVLVLESEIGRIGKELAKRAMKGEVKQIESYISLMSPLNARFVTKEEMERAIKEKLGKKY